MTGITANDPVLAHLPALSLHVLGGGIGIFTGWAAVFAAKGERLHRLFGKVFVVGMALTAMAAIYLASRLTALKHMEQANIAVGFLILYLISTSWLSVRRPPHATGPAEKFALSMGIVIFAIFAIWGVRAEAMGSYDGYAPPLYFGFGIFTALFVAFDIKVIANGGVEGGRRIARHLTRMCAAWFIASTSFFEGQQKIMPPFMRGSNVLAALAFAPLLLMLFWFIRARFANRINHALDSGQFPKGMRPATFGESDRAST